MTRRLMLRRSRRVPLRVGKAGSSGSRVRPRGAVGQQLVVQPRGHVDLPDSGLGLRVAYVDDAVSEVEVADV